MLIGAKGAIWCKLHKAEASGDRQAAQGAMDLPQFRYCSLG